ncbi:MucBP domain-containing protein [Levilactobacillus sp. N40-8-2]|uniref:MucBP domain-containing protein n=1 Tax=Levilactobacillus muriae TaxID=3238987 RepID=UPI0038B2966F
MNTKTHYKMYKKGKSWVIAGIASGAMIMSIGGVTAQANDQAISAKVEVTAKAESTASSVEMTADTIAEVPEVTPVDVAATPVSRPEMETSSEAGADNETPATETPAPETPATETPATETPATETPATETPATETPATETPATETPATETPATETPATEAPATETPVTETPVTETPATETPATETPGTETPVTEASVVEAPTPNSDLETVPETRPAEIVTTPVAVTNQTSASHTLEAVQLVQAEVAKPTTTKLSHTKEATTIDQWMPNKTLQKLVLIHLQKLTGVDKTWDSVDDITQDDLQLLKDLFALGHDGYDTYIDGKTEFSLEGLQYATNLEVIMMGASLNYKPGAVYGDIVDVTPLANLQHLTTVDLQNNRIKDVTPLANLQNLTSLQLAYNHIRDFSPLKGKAPADFNYTGQFIMLEPAMISDKDRKGHLQIQCIDVEGNVVTLTAGAALAEPVFYTDEEGHTYHIYYTGGYPTPDGNGGINYTNIQDQKPGATEFPGATNVAVLDDYYYLTGTYKPQAGVVDFAVVQPYVISQEAANVTVHFQDEDGNELADDVELSGGLVGESYTTTPKPIKGYTLLTTPSNATGKYSETKTDVVYVYTQDEDVAASQTTVTVHHQTADGKPVAADQVQTGKPGDAYTTQPVTPTGYKLVTTPANANGTFGETNITVTYIYQLVEAGNGGDGGSTGGGDNGSGNTGGDNSGSGGNTGDNNGSGNAGGGNNGSGNTGGDNNGSGNAGDGDSGSGNTGGDNNGSGNAGDGDSGSGNTGGDSNGSGNAGSNGNDSSGHNTGQGNVTGGTGAIVTGENSGQSLTTVQSTSDAKPQSLPLSTGENMTSTRPTTEDNRADKETNVDASGVSAMALPQTSEKQSSSLWGIALLLGTFSLLGIKRKKK